MKILEFVKDDGKRIGIPPLTAVFILGLENKPDPTKPKAKTLLRYIAGAGARHAWLRDSFRHVRNQFPMSIGGVGWIETREKDGNDLAIPADSIRAWEELDEAADGDYRITINCESGPLEFDIAADYAELRSLLGEPERIDPDAPPEETAAPKTAARAAARRNAKRAPPK